ncbi:E3 SUMO-protein ligase RanBP2 [Drosophila gunungcola]|uniref:E3 SUMO-protein ligase RanBP2 n=1 Tax=Drosophila gunungcola TaxID=103775 RepID=UPI0022E30B0D|nr:E3 SUMO-protein ligase RanBP2 [Drosophila gunungcola]
MFTTRKEVDEQVHKLLGKLPPGNERDIKGLTVARLYNKIQEYPKAIEYLNSYLRVKDEAVAHKLIALCYSKLKTPDLQKALQHLQRCIQLNPRQHDVIKDACQLLMDEKSNFNTEQAKYWLDLAAGEDLSDNELVFALRMRVNLKESNGGVGDGVADGEDNTMELLMHKELQIRPHDVTARVRLLRNYVEKKKLDQAFNYAFKAELEAKGCTSQSSEWYEMVWLMLSKIELTKDVKKNWRFWQLTLHALDRLMQLSLEAANGLADSSSSLFRLDQYLHKFSNVIERAGDAPQRELHQSCAEHYTGQLLLHAVALIFKRELLGNKNKWMSTLRSVLPLLLLGFQVRPLQESHAHNWMKHCDAEQKQLMQLWRQQGAFRCAQLGRTLLGCLERSRTDNENQKENSNHNENQAPAQTLSGLFGDSEELLSCAHQQCLDKSWRRQLYQLLFTHAEHKLKDQSSHLVHHPRLQLPLFEWPNLAEIETCEQQALLLPPQTLAQHVYLALGTEPDNLGEAPRVLFYEGFRRDVKQNLNYCGYDSISQLDVDLYLYATVIQTQRRLQLQREAYDSSNLGNRNAATRPHMMPYANLVGHMAASEQSNWWDLVLRLHRNQLTTEGNRAEQRAQLQVGLEAVRGVNGPKADSIIIFRLGKILQSRGDRATLEARIDALYRQGFTMLRRQQTQQLDPFVRIFKYGSAASTLAWQELQSLAEHAVTYFSAKMFKAGQYEQFVDEVRGLNLPMATYMQADAYRLLEDSGKAARVSRARFSERRQECLQQTQQLLRNDTKHPLSTVIQRELRRSQQNRSIQGMNDSFGSPDVHNNSSTYEDAEDDFYSGAALSANRSRRQLEPQAPVTPIVVAQPSLEMEQTVKQISKSLCVLKDDVSVGMEAMRQEIKTLTEKFTGLEDLLKKIKISSRDTPTRDVDPASALGLDDFFIIEDALAEHQQQQQQQQHHHNQAAVHQVVPNPYGGPTAGFYNGVPNTPSAQDRFLPGAYGSPMFNQNQMYNYYAAQAQAQAQAQFLRTPPAPGSIPPPNMFGPRNPNFGLPSIFPPPTGPSMAPYIDAMGNFTQPPPSLIPPPAQPAPAPASLSLVDQKPAAAALPTPGFFNPSAPGFGASPIQVPQSKPLSVPTAPVPAAAIVNPPVPVPVAVPAPIQIPQVVAPTLPAPAPAVSVPAMFNRALNNQPVEKEPPANVVITSSDPLPKPTSASVQPTLSVTIPAQHIKPSLVQAPEQQAQQQPQPVVPAPTAAFSFNFGTKSSESPFSFKSQVAKAAAEKQLEQEREAAAELNQSGASDPNKSLQQADNSAADDYDARPDFQAIIPLPDEVEVRTGEEDEEVKFSSRSKLFRLADKEWKERGTGLIKILCDKATGVSRVLMRRDQTHKVCANHKITADMSLATASQDKEKKSFLWVANDFADEQVRLEKFLVRFKTAEVAEEFRLAFTNASQATAKVEKAKPVEKVTQKPVETKEAVAPAAFSPPKSFVTSTPAPNSLFGKPQEQTKPDPVPAPPAAVAKSLFGTLSGVVAAPPAATAPSAPAPFANFSFKGNGTSSGFGSGSTASPFGNLSFGGVSAVGTSNTDNSTLFTTALAKDNTLQSQTPQAQLNKSATSDAEEDYVPTAQFAPVIALPELVEVVTGEENEDVLFEHRAKLLRWDRQSNEWKERGLGNMKILRDRSNPNQVRLLMRREQVHKLCCNQRLMPETKFTAASNIKAAVTWAGPDYSDEEVTAVLLAVRFKSTDVSQEFLDAVQKAQQSIGNEPKKQDDAGEKEKEKEKPAKGFGDAFKPKAGSWSCQGCYTNNGQDQLYCVACQEPKDATVPPKPSTGLDQGNALNLTTSSATKFSFGFAPAALPSTGGFSFGGAATQPKEEVKEKPVVAAVTASASAPAAPAFGFGKTASNTGFGDAFKPKVGSWSCSGCYLNNPGESLYCSACEAPKDDTVPKKENTLGSGLTLPASSQFNFGFGAGNKDNKDNKPTDVVASKSSNVFGSSTFSFAAPVVAAPAAPAGLVGAGSFTFSMPKPNQTQPKSPAAHEGEDNDSHEEEEENNAYFAPVIPLPDKIDVKTGEEDEELLYVHKAKLYRLTEGEWKERGLGDVKILRHRETKKLRVVMRREQVFKICLNHVLNSNVVYKPKSETSWMFAVHDFSEGESVLERFALRFKNQEVAQGFNNAVKKALDGTAIAIEEGSDTAVSSSTLTASTSSADNLLQDHIGGASCRGCDPEKFEFGNATSSPVSSSAGEVNPPLPMTLPILTLPQISSVIPPTAAPAPSIFKASSLGTTTKPSSFSSFTNSPTPEASKPPSSAFLFGSTDKSQSGGTAATPFANLQKSISSGGQGNVLGSIFSSSVLNQAPADDSAKSIFGGGEQKKESPNSNSIFGGVKPDSQSAANQEASKSIFGNTGGAPVFGGPNPFGLPKVESQPLDGKEAPKSIFGGTPSIFGSTKVGSQAAPASQDASKSIFGGSPSVFGGSTGGSFVFGSGTVFGQKEAPVSFTDLGKQAAQPEKVAEETKDKQDTVTSTTFADLGNKAGSTFADLANKPAGGTFADFANKATNDFANLSANSQGNPTVFNKSGGGSGGFYNLTHQNAFKNFGSASQTGKNNESGAAGDGDEDGDGTTDDNYDPHYDPIVELPDEIVVTTGEENETKLYGERAKLYRYDTELKQWKERGVGEIKVLEHPELQTFRLVMRQEQIHKLVLNMKITGTMQFDYMNEQKKSFLWAGYNYAVDAEGKVGTEGVLERLACRFGKEETADVFLKTVNSCVQRAKALDCDQEDEQDSS